MSHQTSNSVPTGVSISGGPVRNRGEGLVYNGSLVEYRGSVVIEIDDCYCEDCIEFETWDPRRRYDVRLTDHEGLEQRLEHCGPESLTGRG